MTHRYLITTGGGLGNQILQYALWLFLKKKGQNAYYYMLDDKLKEAIPHLSIPNVSVLDRILVKYRTNIYFLFDVVSLVIRRKRLDRTPVLFHRVIIDFLQWDDYTFISGIRNELKQKLSFPIDNDSRNRKIKEIMTTTNSVSIHVRRGDYQNSIKWRTILGDICDQDYYNKAICRIREIIMDPVFFIFSDDIQWAKDHIEVKDPIFIDWNQGNCSFRDLELMTFCKTNVISNSTFSLCATWLNVNKDVLRIAPMKWRNIYNDNLRCRYLSDDDAIFIDNRIPQISIVCQNELSQEEVSYFKKQTYSDYEVVSVYFDKDDVRFHNGTPCGRHRLDYIRDMMPLLKDRHYLIHWIQQLYVKNR